MLEKSKITELYETFGQDVYRMALSYLHSREDAEDVCHNVFLKLLEKDVTLFPGKEKAWLLTCTANACKNHMNSFWKKHTQELDEKLVFSGEEDKDLWEALTALNPRDRALLHLYYYEGYAQEEIAGILCISRSSVQTRMQRARQKLEKELNAYE